MKRINRNLILLMVLFCIPLVIASGQEKENEKKIKIVVDDGSGKKTVIDTVFSGSTSSEKIEVKDGKLIFIGDDDKTISLPEGKKIIVTVDTDKDGEKEVTKDIIITTADSAKWTVSSGGRKKGIYVYSSTDNNAEKNIVISSADDDVIALNDKDGIVITKAEVVKSSNDNTFRIIVKDEEEMDSDATKYVIAKDGVVVTVECDDEAKANEIIKLIQDKLGVKNDEKKE